MTTTPVSSSDTPGLVSCDLDRDVIVAEGPDAGEFLHSQLANDIITMSNGDTVHSLLLEPTGHVVSLVRVVRCSPDRFTLDLERGHGDIVIARLKRFLLRAKVEISVSELVVRAFRGANAYDLISSAIDTELGCIARPWWNDPHAVDVIAAIGALSDIERGIDQISDPHVTVDQLTIDRIRVDAGWPRMVIDIEPGDIPATTGVLSIAVSFTKGCYPGQELVERMDSRGTRAPIVLRSFDRSSSIDDAIVTSTGNTRVLARVPRSSLDGEELSSGWSS